MASPVARRPDPSGSSTTSALFERIGAAEIALERLQTELTGYAKHTSDAISELADQLRDFAKTSEGRAEAVRQEFHRWQDTSRPNYLGIASIVLGLVIAGAGLIAFSSDARIRPLEREVANHKELLVTHRVENGAALEKKDREFVRFIEMVESNNQLKHSELDRRVTALEEKMRTRMSDSDDRQDAEIRELQRVLGQARQP
jgi:hypothetical protein